jgi:DNA anti-recombination protein RmuC
MNEERKDAVEMPDKTSLQAMMEQGVRGLRDNLLKPMRNDLRDQSDRLAKENQDALRAVNANIEKRLDALQQELDERLAALPGELADALVQAITQVTWDDEGA